MLFIKGGVTIIYNLAIPPFAPTESSDQFCVCLIKWSKLIWHVKRLTALPLVLKWVFAFSPPYQEPLPL